ncbi:hypothetical protein SO802_019541 [Lithocarpus litseifolius]|uniref:Transmembrane protein n=1 Tax=Lithocarpus litseifolius TaxID=425828 RepID=A0AAW2CPG6_9ROSI
MAWRSTWSRHSHGMAEVEGEGWILDQRRSWWYGFGLVGCVGCGSGGGFGVMGQVGLWCGDLWVSLGYLKVVLLGLGVVCVFIGGFDGGFVDGSDVSIFSGFLQLYCLCLDVSEDQTKVLSLCLSLSLRLILGLQSFSLSDALVGFWVCVKAHIRF